MKNQIAELGAEYWKLLRNFERTIERVPDDDRPRLQATARYAASRLSSILENADLRIVCFDGQQFEVNLPVVPVNSDEVQGVERTVVERTLEPTVLDGMTVLMTGKVYLIPAA